MSKSIDEMENESEGTIPESDEEPSLDDQLQLFCKQVDDEQARRDKELFEFLEELINSDEFRPKKERKDASTQVLPKYLEKYAKEIKELVVDLVDDYGLTRYYQKRSAQANLKRSKEKCDENKRIRRWQEDAINIIKDHIYDAARAHACHLKERIENRLEKISRALGGLPFRPEFKKKAIECVLSIKRTKRNQRIGRKEREVSIINKLVNERKRWKQIQAIQNKTYDYKVKPRKKAVESPEIKEESFVSGICVEGEIEEELPLEGFVVEGLFPQEEIKDVKKGKKGKKDKKAVKKEKKSKKGKTEKKKKKDKKGKKDKKKKKGQQPDLILPEIPIINPRGKITCDNPELMADILRQHEELLLVVNEKKYFDAILDRKESLYERDVDCFWKPNPLLFKDFENGKIYKKKLTVINGGKVSKKIKLYAALIDDGFDPYLIDVDKFGIAVVIPGLSFNVLITFRPRQLNRVTYGKLIFITYEANRNEYKQFAVPIKCLPSIRQVFITPLHIRYGIIPFWEVKNLKPKRLRVISTDTKSYCVRFKKVLEESHLEELSEIIASPSMEPVEQILEELTDICYHNFKFSSYCQHLPANSGFEIKIYPRHLDQIGTYWERFECQFYDESESGHSKYVGCQECMVSAEITDHFMKITPDILDFGVCTFGSVYQEKFELWNGDLSTHRVLLQFPSSVKYYLSSSMAEIIISPNESREVSLKFIPKEDMIDGFLSCYDPITRILKFPIKARIVTKDYDRIPSIRSTIYAILSENMALSIRPLKREWAKRNGDDFLLDLGTCFSRECVFAKLGITNSSATKQHFGFLDLPNCVSISPNYGFGCLDPYECKQLTVLFNPQHCDISNMEGGGDSILTFRISVTSLKHIGALKKTFNYKKLRRSFQHVLNILRKEESNPLVKEMSDCLQILRDSDELVLRNSSIRVGEEEYIIDMIGQEEEEGLLSKSINQINESSTQGLDQIHSNKIWLRAGINDPPVSLSHQLVIFPNTPCGSYSTMRLQLKTYKYLVDTECLCGFKPPNKQEFQIHFEISGDNPEITIEPICGDLSSGNSIDLHLVAKPGVPRKIVEEKAYYLKEMEIIEEKRKQILVKREQDRQIRLLRQKVSKAKKTKVKEKRGKKRKKTSEVENEPVEVLQSEVEDEPLPEIIVNPADIHINYFDLYPAEMVIWRDFQPQLRQANFTFEITYHGKNVDKERDFLYLKAICKVISPSFIHNFDRQHLDFGKTAVGSSSRKILELQNVRDTDIAPTTSYLSPMGAFTCPNIADISLPSEHILRIPITFKPFDDQDKSKPAAFGIQTKRFSPIGFHPKLDPSGSLRAYKNKLSPCDYFPKDHQCAYKKYNKAGSPWKRKANSEEYAANLGFRNHTILEERRYLKSIGGPGSYDISEQIYKKKSFSILNDVNFGYEVKFFQLNDCVPAPGTYTKDITNSCVIKKQLTSRPPFEWDGFLDRFKVPSKSWSKPPNLYNPIVDGSIESLLTKVVSKKGPYNLFTGPRDGSTIKNHFTPAKKCAPDKYYTWPNGLDYLLHHLSKRRYGALLKDARFRKKPTVRMLMNDLTTCYRDPNEPSPATYDIKVESIRKLEPSLYPFNDSQPIARKGVKWVIQPGPGRYNITMPRCKKVKTQSWVFKSGTGRSEFKPEIYSLFPE